MSRYFIEGKLLALSLMYIVVGASVFALSARVGIRHFGVLPLSSIFSLILLGVGLITIAVRSYSVIYATSIVLSVVVTVGILAAGDSLPVDTAFLLTVFAALWISALLFGKLFSLIEGRSKVDSVQIDFAESTQREPQEQHQEKKKAAAA